jgi:hypothetical protein
MVGHLLAWEMHEHDGTWHAWVSWVQQAGGRHVHKVVDVRAGSLQPLEPPDAYSAVPRRVRGSDGLIRPWSGESGLRRGCHRLRPGAVHLVASLTGQLAGHRSVEVVERVLKLRKGAAHPHANCLRGPA